MTDLQKHWPLAKANGIEYITYYARIRAGMSAEKAATKPLSKAGAKLKPGSITQLCKKHRIWRGAFYATRQKMLDESGRLPTPVEVIEAIEKRRGGV